MLRKRDELQFPFLFAHIRLRPEQGILIFLSCRTREVEVLLVDKIKTEFSGQFPIKEVPFETGNFIPLQMIAIDDDFSPQTLYIIDQFPFEEFYKNPESMESQLERLTTALNLAREYFTSRDLKCVFICPPEVENRIALKAPDFYLFTHYSASFTDDQAFHREIESLERGGQDKRERIAFLNEVLGKTSGEEDKAYLYSELGHLYYELSEIDQALEYWQKALVIYRKSKDKKRLADVLGNIGLVYQKLDRPEEALKHLKDALEIHRKIGYLHGEASALGNIGLVFADLGQEQEALAYLKDAKRIFL